MLDGEEKFPPKGDSVVWLLVEFDPPPNGDEAEEAGWEPKGFVAAGAFDEPDVLAALLVADPGELPNGEEGLGAADPPKGEEAAVLEAELPNGLAAGAADPPVEAPGGCERNIFAVDPVEEELLAPLAAC